jgi:hypothetical protein
MHRFFSLLLLPALAIPALPLVALADEPPKTEAVRAPGKRMTWEQRFAKADVAQDGHLTPEEAKGSFPLVARNFSKIDLDGKGYVTANDVRAWYALRKAARAGQHPPEDTLRPRKAYQRAYPDQKPAGVKTSVRMTVSSGQ